MTVRLAAQLLAALSAEPIAHLAARAQLMMMEGAGAAFAERLAEADKIGAQMMDELNRSHAPNAAKIMAVAALVYSIIESDCARRSQDVASVLAAHNVAYIVHALRNALQGAVEPAAAESPAPPAAEPTPAVHYVQASSDDPRAVATRRYIEMLRLDAEERGLAAAFSSGVSALMVFARMQEDTAVDDALADSLRTAVDLLQKSPEAIILRVAGRA